jgi:hypothetical protein
MYVNAQNNGLPINGSQFVVGNQTIKDTKKSKINKDRNPINALLKKNEEKKESNKNVQNSINNMNNQNLSNNVNPYQDNTNGQLDTNKMAFFNIDTKKELEKAKSTNNNSNLFDLQMGTDKLLFPTGNNNSNYDNKNLQSNFQGINTEQFLNNNIQWQNQNNINNINYVQGINQNIDEINTKKLLEQNKINNGGFINPNMNSINSVYQQNSIYNNFNYNMNGMNNQMMGNFKIYNQ